MCVSEFCVGSANTLSAKESRERQFSILCLVPSQDTPSTVKPGMVAANSRGKPLSFEEGGIRECGSFAEGLR
jgi:hypothetical protein